MLFAHSTFLFPNTNLVNVNINIGISIFLNMAPLQNLVFAPGASINTVQNKYKNSFVKLKMSHNGPASDDVRGTGTLSLLHHYRSALQNDICPTLTKETPRPKDEFPPAKRICSLYLLKCKKMKCNPSTKKDNYSTDQSHSSHFVRGVFSLLILSVPFIRIIPLLVFIITIRTSKRFSIYIWTWWWFVHMCSVCVDSILKCSIIVVTTCGVTQHFVRFV